MEPGESTGTTVTLLGRPRRSSRPPTTPWRRSPTASARWPSSTRASRSSSATSGPTPSEIVDAVEDDTVADDDRPGRLRRDQARRGRRPGARLQVRPRPGRLRRAPQPPQGQGQPDDHLLRGRDARTRREPHEPRGRDAVEHHLHRVGAHLREHHQHPRGRHPRGGLPRRADRPGQQLGRGVGPDQEARGPRLRRRHPRGPDRDHLDQAGRAAVRGPDQDQARQHRGQGLRAEGRQRPAR